MKKNMITPLFTLIFFCNLLDASQFAIPTDGMNEATENLFDICRNNQNVRPGYLGKLIYQGADVNYKDLSFLTPLCYAVLHGNVEYVRILCRSGRADLTTKFGVDQDSILHIASSVEDNPLMIKALLCPDKKRSNLAGAEINVMNDDHRNAAHYAMLSSNFAIANFLLEHTVDLTQRDTNNKRPYDCIADLPVEKQPDSRFERKLYKATREQERNLRN